MRVAQTQVEESRGVDITEEMVSQHGFDWQAIVWGYPRITREEFLLRRKLTVTTNRNTEDSLQPLVQEAMSPTFVENLVTPHRMYRQFQPSALHFQLKCMLQSTRRDRFYYLRHSHICQADTSAVKSPQTGQQFGSEKEVAYVRSLLPCSMCVHENILAVGGLEGDLLCVDLLSKGEVFRGKICDSDSAITNSLSVTGTRGSGHRLVCCNNDKLTRFIDLPSFVCCQQFSFPWCVNRAEISPDGSQMVVVGDSTECQLFDLRSNSMTAELTGHLDYNFACCWHPSKPLMVTGGEDHSLRVWDTRNLSESVTLLFSDLCAVRSVQFSPDGSLMFWAEEMDFAHINDVEHDFKLQQDISVLGDITGMSMSPEGDYLWLGCGDQQYGGVLEFKTNALEAAMKLPNVLW